MRPLRIAIGPSAEKIIFEWLCIGIVYSFFFWTLLNSICCISLFAAWLLICGKSFNFSSARTRLIFLFACLYLASLTGIFYTSNTSEGLSRLQEKVPILIFPLIFGTTGLLTTRLVNKITFHFVIGAAISALSSICYGLWQYTRTGLIESITARNLQVFPDSYPYLLGLSSLLAIILMLTGTVSVSTSRKWLQLCIISILSLHIILLGTRVIIACWAIVILIGVIAGIGTLLKRVLALVLLACTTALLITAIPTLRRQWKEFTDPPEKTTIPLDRDGSLGTSWGGKSIREAIWKCSSDLVRHHWLAGVGTGDIQDSLQQAYENRKFYFASRYNRYNAHSQYLQTLLGHGVGGLAILILCIILPLGGLLIHIRALPSLQTCYLAFLCLFCALCFTEVILDVNKGVILYAFFNSVFAFASPLHKLKINPDSIPHGKSTIG